MDTHLRSLERNDTVGFALAQVKFLPRNLRWLKLDILNKEDYYFFLSGHKKPKILPNPLTVIPIDFEKIPVDYESIIANLTSRWKAGTTHRLYLPQTGDFVHFPCLTPATVDISDRLIEFKHKEIQITSKLIKNKFGVLWLKPVLV